MSTKSPGKQNTERTSRENECYPTNNVGSEKPGVVQMQATVVPYAKRELELWVAIGSSTNYAKLRYCDDNLRTLAETLYFKCFCKNSRTVAAGQPPTFSNVKQPVQQATRTGRENCRRIRPEFAPSACRQITRVRDQYLRELVVELLVRGVPLQSKHKHINGMKTNEHTQTHCCTHERAGSRKHTSRKQEIVLQKRHKTKQA